jgi:hypothetical protein
MNIEKDYQLQETTGGLVSQGGGLFLSEEGNKQYNSLIVELIRTNVELMGNHGMQSRFLCSSRAVMVSLIMPRISRSSPARGKANPCSQGT